MWQLALRRAVNLKLSITGKSIFLQGRFSKNGIQKPFTISSENAFGNMHDLLGSSGKIHVTIGSESIRVQFVRRLAVYLITSGWLGRGASVQIALQVK